MLDAAAKKGYTRKDIEDTVDDLVTPTQEDNSHDTPSNL